MPMLLLLQLLLLLPEAAAAAVDVRFQHASFATPADDIVIVSSSWYDGPPASYNASAIWLTPATAALPLAYGTNLGRVVYKYPILFDASTSFASSFSFQIVPSAPFPKAGSGMAFFLSDSLYEPPNSDTSGALGLVDPAHALAPYFFALEFDTRASSLFADPSSSHIGIDINSMISSAYIDTSPNASAFYPELFLYNNYTFTAWVEYNASDTLTQIWMTNDTSSSATRPLQPCLRLHYNLWSAVFQSRPIYAGFSANSAPKVQALEGHALFSWNFSTSTPTAGTPSHPHKSTSVLALALAPVGATLLLLALLILVVVRRRNRRKSSTGDSKPLTGKNHSTIASAGQQVRSPQRYTYNELRRATQGFDDSNKVGEGAFSVVYRGTLPHGAVAAVKKLKEGPRRKAEFLAEISIISKIRHRCLLQLQGWCYEKGEALLVYNYMGKGNLDSYLFGERRGSLNGQERFKILEGVAAALEYLHNWGLEEHCVLHRDVKPANVLLNERLEPVLADFGVSRLVQHHHVQEDAAMSNLTVAGTRGYVAPEVLFQGKPTAKSDVHSFGVLALVTACGRRAYSDGDIHVADWVWLHQQENQLMEALDPVIQAEVVSDPAGEDSRWRCVLHLAMVCCHPSPDVRPSMTQVIQALRDPSGTPHHLPAAWPGPYPYNYSSNNHEMPRSVASLQLVHGSSSSSAPNSEMPVSPR